MLSWYKKSYETPQELYEGLKMEVTPAIETLIKKVTPYIDSLGRKNGLSVEDIEDLIYISVAKHMECIRKGTYELRKDILKRDICPSHFTFAIAKERVKDYWRKKTTVELAYAAGTATPSHLKSIETKDLLDQGFQRLSNNDEQLLRKTYEEGFKDKELIQDDDLDYDNEPALRTARKRAKEKLQALLQPLYGLFWVAIQLTNY